MTEAEIIEQITKKRNELEEKTAAKASPVVLKAIEAEIKMALPRPVSMNFEPKE